MFKTGQILLSNGIANFPLLQFHVFVQQSIQKHIKGDWGDLCEEDVKSNDLAVKQGSRIFSSYIIPDTIESFAKKIWIITEADRSATTVLFPSEY